MAVKRIVDVQFWNDDKVIEFFSPQDKLFMLYLMTNPHSTQLGIYSINKKIIAFETGYSCEEINKLLNRFEKEYKMIKYSETTKEIAIKNYLKYSVIKGGKPVEDLLIKEIGQVKDKNLLKYVYSNIKNYEALNVTVKKVFDNIIINDNENDNDNENEKSVHNTQSVSSTCRQPIVDFKEDNNTIINHLNKMAGTNFKNTSKSTIKLISALLKDYSVDDIIMVIDKMCYLWNREPKKGEKDMRIYLRPSTLFRKSNFENYLGMNVPKKEITTKDIASQMDFSEFR